MNKKLTYYIRKNVKYYPGDVAETAQNELDQGTPIEDIPAVIERLFQTPDIETSLNLHAQVKQACDEYTRDHMPQLKLSAKDLIEEINYFLKDLKMAFGNAIFFGIDKTEFSEETVELLNIFLDQLITARGNINHFHEYIPNCNNNCKECLFSYRNGCKKKKHQERFDRWAYRW